MLIYESEQIEHEEYLQKYSRLFNLQERERQISAEIKEKAEKLAITISEDRIATEHKKRLEMQNKLKELEETKKKQEENYKKNIQWLQEQLREEQALTCRIAQYIAEIEDVTYSDDEELIAKINDFVTEQEEMDVEPPESYYF